MKRYAFIILCTLAIIPAAAFMAGASDISVTRHNLSPSGPGSIRTSFGTTEICIFCHTPHSARSDAPLWNKTNVEGPYEVYSSDVLSELGYQAPDSPLTPATGNFDVHVKTRICLSCHDGTIALGSLVNFSGSITMQGTDGVTGGIPQQAAGYIGLDLRDDHPVAVKYLGPTADPELKDPVTGNVRVYDSMTGGKAVSAGANSYVECTSCHDAHTDNRKFLVDVNLASQICTSCHNKDLGSAVSSAHDDAAAVAYNPDGSGAIGTFVGNVKCMNCHFPHKAGINDTSLLPNATPADLTANPRLGYYLLTYQEEMSCFNSQSRWTAGAVSACHGGTAPATRNIETVETSNPTSRHGTVSQSGRHEATEGKGGNLDKGWINSGGALARWHVECADCHNPHTANSTLHAAGTNLVDMSSPLYGASGVEMTGTPTWAAPSTGSYDYIKGVGVTDNAGLVGVTKEYQICFKCHTDFAWGGGTAPDSPALGLGKKMTNQAVEFGNSISFHPVLNQTGRNTGTLSGGWSVSQGVQTMYCSDCHTKENDSSPSGPHGSSNQGILVWPANGDNYGTAGGQTQQNSDLCLKCHDPGKYNTNNGADNSGGTDFRAGTLNLHNRHVFLESGGSGLPNRRAYKCVNCHARVPHGLDRRAMVVYRNDGDGYEAQGVGTGLIVNGATPLPAPGSYVKTSCASYTANGVIGCHD